MAGADHNPAYFRELGGFVAQVRGADIWSRTHGYRTDHIKRYERIEATGDIDALFFEFDIEYDD